MDQQPLHSGSLSIRFQEQSDASPISANAHHGASKGSVKSRVHIEGLGPKVNFAAIKVINRNQLDEGEPPKPKLNIFERNGIWFPGREALIKFNDGAAESWYKINVSSFQKRTDIPKEVVNKAIRSNQGDLTPLFTAYANYEKGNEALKRRDFDKAKEYFEAAKAGYSGDTIVDRYINEIVDKQLSLVKMTVPELLESYTGEVLNETLTVERQQIYDVICQNKGWGELYTGPKGEIDENQKTKLKSQLQKSLSDIHQYKCEQKIRGQMNYALYWLTEAPADLEIAANSHADAQYLQAQKAFNEAIESVIKSKFDFAEKIKKENTDLPYTVRSNERVVNLEYMGMLVKYEAYLKQAADQGHQKACLDLANFYEKFGDLKQAGLYYKKAADLGSSEALGIIGLSHLKNNNLKLAKSYLLQSQEIGEQTNTSHGIARLALSYLEKIENNQDWGIDDIPHKGVDYQDLERFSKAFPTESALEFPPEVLERARNDFQNSLDAARSEKDTCRHIYNAINTSLEGAIPQRSFDSLGLIT